MRNSDIASVGAAIAVGGADGQAVGCGCTADTGAHADIGCCIGCAYAGGDGAVCGPAGRSTACVGAGIAAYCGMAVRIWLPIGTVAAP
jgi:hypothetical protein